MKVSTFLVAAAASTVHGQRPANVSICDYYTQALFKVNNATTQDTLLTALVNTAVIGNYTTPNHNVVRGILASNATYNGTKVNLLQYFDGSLESTNIGKSHGVSVNFLDGGGAAPLTQNKPANNKDSRQYTLLTHLYSFFGTLLGCSAIGKPGFPMYMGDPSMYDVHKFMSLDAYEVQYFIEQVGLAATSFGVSVADVESVGMVLQDLFGYRCAPKTSWDYAAKPELQSICIASDCPESPNATCNAYGPQPSPPSSSSSSSSSSSGKPNSNSSMATSVPQTGAASSSMSMPASVVSVGFFVFLLLV